MNICKFVARLYLTFEEKFTHNSNIIEQLFNYEVYMCNHCHEHNHSHKSNCSKLFHPIYRVVISILILSGVYIFNVNGIYRMECFLVAYLISGSDILYSALKNILKGKVFDENFLMGIASLGAFLVGEYPEAVMVMVLYQIGEYFQDKAVEKSRNSITELMDIRPDYANIEENGRVFQKSPDDIKIGDVILVKAGEKIPLDGIIIEGNAIVDTAALTGEAVPRNLKVGDSAISGCININGVMRIRVEKEFGESTVSRILKLVEESGSKKAKAENFITKFAKYYTPFVVISALFLGLIPPLFFNGDFQVWILRALTFLVISCPCALVISVPLTFFAGIGGASKNGILIKGGCYMEVLAKPDTVVFDKTGTLTKGIFSVSKLVPSDGVSDNQLIEYAAKAEYYSNHPIALSLKEFYGKDINSDEVSDVKEVAGLGLEAVINSDKVVIGNAKLMEAHGVYLEFTTEVGTVIHVLKNNKYLGYIVISDELKEDSKDAIKNLKKLGIKTEMLTGDTSSVANFISEELGVDKVYSELLPADKVEKVEDLFENKRNYKSIIFVGDGINDAPVLARADVGIAMGALGSDAAIEAADVVIMDDKPLKVVLAIAIARKTMSVVMQNIIFAVGIKVLFLILGVFGFITMWGAVFADVGVALLAVLNALRAYRVKSL